MESFWIQRVFYLQCETVRREYKFNQDLNVGFNVGILNDLLLWCDVYTVVFVRRRFTYPNMELSDTNSSLIKF